MPVPGMDMSECPRYPVEGKPGFHHRVFVDVFLIVVVNESVAKGLGKDDPNDSHKEHADDPSAQVLGITATFWSAAVLRRLAEGFIHRFRRFTQIGFGVQIPSKNLRKSV